LTKVDIVGGAERRSVSEWLARLPVEIDDGRAECWGGWIADGCEFVFLLAVELLVVWSLFSLSKFVFRVAFSAWRKLNLVVVSAETFLLRLGVVFLSLQIRFQGRIFRLKKVEFGGEWSFFSLSKSVFNVAVSACSKSSSVVSGISLLPPRAVEQARTPTLNRVAINNPTEY
jgi:hypothetical protein